MELTWFASEGRVFRRTDVWELFRSKLLLLKPTQASRALREAVIRDERCVGSEQVQTTGEP